MAGVRIVFNDGLHPELGRLRIETICGGLSILGNWRSDILF
jgi:hypothetical protein